MNARQSMWLTGLLITAILAAIALTIQFTLTISLPTVISLILVWLLAAVAILAIAIGRKKVASKIKCCNLSGTQWLSIPPIILS